MIPELQRSYSQERLEFGMGLDAQRGTVGGIYLFLFICPGRSNRYGGTTSGVLSLQAEVPGLRSLLIPELSAGCRRGSSPGGLVL